MANGMILFSQKVDEKTIVPRGVNEMLITHFEGRPQGGALLHMMGGATVELDPAQWAIVGKKLLPPTEPQAG